MWGEGENLTMASERDNATCQETQRKFNQEQYDILRRCSEENNIAEWNGYRAEQPETPIQLQNADLRRARLEGAQLAGASLEGARFEGADLLATDLRNADLRKANFENANLWGATLGEANLEGARLVSASLENADLRGANLEKANLRGANLEGAIVEGANFKGATVEIDTEDNLPGSKEEVEVVFNVADDIDYNEFASLIRCMERLSLIVGGSPPHLNEIQISHHIEEHVARGGTEMDNMISINIPKNVAENLHEIFLWGITTGQARNEGAEAETVAGKEDSGACDHLRELLTSAGFSENERETILANQTLPSMEEDRMLEDIRFVANLIGCRQIYFQA